MRAMVCQPSAPIDDDSRFSQLDILNCFEQRIQDTGQSADEGGRLREILGWYEYVRVGFAMCDVFRFDPDHRDVVAGLLIDESRGLRQQGLPETGSVSGEVHHCRQRGGRQ